MQMMIRNIGLCLLSFLLCMHKSRTEACMCLTDMPYWILTLVHVHFDILGPSQITCLRFIFSAYVVRPLTNLSQVKLQLFKSPEAHMAMQLTHAAETFHDMFLPYYTTNW